MAKFCTKCGSELKEGKCPKCKDEKKVEVVQTTDMKESFMDCLDVIKTVITKPIDTIKEFVSENKYITGIIMLVLTALSTGLYKIATLKNIYSAKSPDAFNTNDFADLLNTALSGGTFKNEPEYLKEFMTTFAYNLAEYALIAVIGYFVITKLFKGTITIKEMFSVVGIALAVTLCANLVNSILVFIDGEAIGYIRSYVLSFGSIFSYLLIYEGTKKVSDIDKEKVFLSVASMCIFATAVIDIFHKIFN